MKRTAIALTLLFFSIGANALIAKGAFYVIEASKYKGPEIAPVIDETKLVIDCYDETIRRTRCEKRIVIIDHNLIIETMYYFTDTVENDARKRTTTKYCKISEKSENGQFIQVFYKDFTNLKSSANMSTGRYVCEYYWHLPL